MLPNDLYTLYFIRPTKDRVTYSPAARFMVHDGDLHFLEDNYGFMGEHFHEGPMSYPTMERIERFNRDGYLHLVSRTGQLKAKEDQHKKVGKPVDDRTGVFEYHYGQPGPPNLVHFKDGKVFLDGNSISPEEATKIKDNVRAGNATLRYQKDPNLSKLKKMEELFDDLTKGEMSSETLIESHARGQHPDQIYGDSLAPGVENLFSFNKFKEKQIPGTYVAMDGSPMNLINEAGHDVGDQALAAYGKALKESATEVCPDAHHVFRVSGDKFLAHFPSMIEAHNFEKAVKAKLETSTVQSPHQLGMHFGIAPSYDAAQEALKKAKVSKETHIILPTE